MRKIHRSNNQSFSGQFLDVFSQPRSVLHMMCRKSQKINSSNSREKLIDPAKMLPQTMIFRIDLSSFLIKNPSITSNTIIYKRSSNDSLIFKPNSPQSTKSFYTFLFQKKMIRRKKNNLIWHFMRRKKTPLQKRIKILNFYRVNHKMRDNSEKILTLTRNTRKRKENRNC